MKASQLPTHLTATQHRWDAAQKNDRCGKVPKRYGNDTHNSLSPYSKQPPTPLKHALNLPPASTSWCVPTSTRARAHTLTHAHTCMHAHARTHAHPCRHAHARTPMHTHAHPCTRTHTHAFPCTHAHVRTWRSLSSTTWCVSCVPWLKLKRATLSPASSRAPRPASESLGKDRQVGQRRRG